MSEAMSIDSQSTTSDNSRMQRDDLLTSTQAGLVLGKSGRTILRMAEAGLIVPVAKLPGSKGAFLFKRSDVEKFA